MHPPPRRSRDYSNDHCTLPSSIQNGGSEVFCVSKITAFPREQDSWAATWQWLREQLRRLTAGFRPSSTLSSSWDLGQSPNLSLWFIICEWELATPPSQVPERIRAQAERWSCPSQGSVGGHCYQHCLWEFWTHFLAEKVFQVRQKEVQHGDLYRTSLRRPLVSSPAG